MDKFKYTIESQHIQSLTTKIDLLALIQTYSRKRTKIDSSESIDLTIRYAKALSPNNRLPTKDLWAQAIYYYQLYIEARARYLELFDINELPKYAQRPVLTLDIDKTIENFIKDTQ